MNGVDLVLGLVVLLFVWMGWQKGAIAGFSDLFVWVGSLIAGLAFYESLSPLLSRTFPSVGAWSKPLSFFILILGVRLVLAYFISLAISKLQPDVHTSLPNKTLGLVPGFANGLLNAAIIAALLLLVPFSQDLSQTAADSEAARKLSGPLGWFNEKMTPIFAEPLAQRGNGKRLSPKPEETVDLPFNVRNAKPDAQAEMAMIELVNEERVREGLNRLIFDPELVPVARAHSDDMFERGYFSHYAPEGDAVSHRLKKAGITYRMAGENLALAPTLTAAHSGLMNSSGHRANILHKSYRKIGIGILDGGIRGLMVTQIFKN